MKTLPLPAELDTHEKRVSLAALYTRVIVWSHEDNCYVGGLPEIDGWCTHADTAEECARNLDECALIAVEDYADGETGLNAPGSCTILPPSRYHSSEAVNEDIAALRHKLGYSQSTFAALLGVSLSTVRHWEQGLRKPDGASARLLSIADKHPEALSY